MSKLHYGTHGSKGFPSTRRPNCTTAHTDPRASSVQTSQLRSDPMATQADPASIPSLIYNTNKKTGWGIRSKSRILRGGGGGAARTIGTQTNLTALRFIKHRNGNSQTLESNYLISSTSKRFNSGQSNARRTRQKVNATSILISIENQKRLNLSSGHCGGEGVRSPLISPSLHLSFLAPLHLL